MIRLKVRLDEQTNRIGMRKVEGKYVECLKVSVVLVPVSDDSPENKKFWDATPSGKIEFTYCNAEAIEELTLGKEYYVDFTEAAPVSS
ncbi:MAG: hypothetical protein KAX31_01765 [Thermoplasmata archaeon]|nr:hypothetical protein [Thermoplasmata archaeon]